MQISLVRISLLRFFKTFHKYLPCANFGLHCNPLQGNYWVELVHREIPVVITGNGFAVCMNVCKLIYFQALLESPYNEIYKLT